MKARIAALALAVWSGLAALASAEVPDPGRVAFFGLTFIDTSTEGAMNGIRADETARTEMATALVAEDMAGRGFVLVPTDPVAGTLAKVTNPARCNGCDVAMAKELGADYALAGEVQKVSNLILNLNLVLRDASTGEVVRAGSVDIRGNTDESWQRGLRYLMKNIIFRDQ
jgi:Protein of unknown function (DUF2380)